MMKISCANIIFVLLGSAQFFTVVIAGAYRTDILENMEAQYCESRKHLTFKPTATCCMSQVLKPGINAELHWQACSNEVAGNSNTIAKIGWDMYACIVKKSNEDKDEISLKEFSDLMTATYPDDIKSKINEEIEKQSVASASLTDYEKLEKIRVTYYDIETEVCEGMPSETKTYGKIETCVSYKEEGHRAGSCCKQSYPVDIRFKSLMDLENRQDILNTCQEDIREPLQKLNVSETMKNSLMEICDLACAMSQRGMFSFKDHIIENKEYWKWNWTDVFFSQNMLPRLFHDDLKMQAFQYASSAYSLNNTIEAMKSFEFADLITQDDSYAFRKVGSLAYIAAGNKSMGDNFKLDFMPRRFHARMLQVPVICSGYREVLSLMEYALYRKENCQPDEVVENNAEEAAPPEETAVATDPPAEESNADDSAATEAAAEE